MPRGRSARDVRAAGGRGAEPPPSAAGRAGLRRRAAGAPRPALRLRRPGRPGRRRGARARRVKVRFAGQDVDGYVVERAPTTPSTTAALAPLRQVVSAEPVLTPRSPALARARRRPLRRHPRRRAAARRPAAARQRREASRAGRRRPPRRRARAGPEPWGALPGRARPSCARPRRRRAPARGLVGAARAPTGRGRLARRRSPPRVRRRAAARWSACPTRRDVDRVDARADRAALGAGRHVALTADAGPGGALPRASWPSAAGTVRSSSAPAPPRSPRSRDLGLVAIWDDGDDLHAEPRAPYPHAREVLLHCAPSVERRRRCWSAASRAPSRRSSSSRPAGRASSAADRATVCARGAARARRRRRRRPGARRPAARAPGCPRGVAARPRGRLARRARCWCRAPRAATCPSSPASAAATPARCAHLLRPARADRAPTRAAACRLVRARRPPAGRCPECGAARGCGRPWSATRRTAEELGPRVPGHRRCATSGPATGVLAAVDGRRRSGRRHPRRRAGRRRRLRRGAAARHAGCC